MGAQSTQPQWHLSLYTGRCLAARDARPLVRRFCTQRTICRCCALGQPLSCEGPAFLAEMVGQLSSLPGVLDEANTG